MHLKFEIISTNSYVWKQSSHWGLQKETCWTHFLAPSEFKDMFKVLTYSKSVACHVLKICSSDTVFLLECSFNKYIFIFPSALNGLTGVLFPHPSDPYPTDKMHKSLCSGWLKWQIRHKFHQIWKFVFKSAFINIKDIEPNYRQIHL